MQKRKANSTTIERYYNRYWWLYPALWGKTIHWGRFLTGQETLEEAASLWTDWIIELLETKEGDRILDVGCGPATTDRRLITATKVVVDGVDISEAQLNRARAAQSDLVGSGGLRLIKADIASAQLAAGAYQAAFSLAVFFHFHDRPAALLKIRECLTEAGRLVFDDLVIQEPIAAADFKVAFGRFGGLNFERADAYPKLLRKAGFRLAHCFDIGDDVARTYTRLLDALDAQRVRQPTLIKPRLCLGLRGSFRKITELLWDGRLGARLYVVLAS